MIATALILLALIGVSFYSRIHGIGLWLVILVTHGILYQVFGKETQHLPLFSGIILLVIAIACKQWSEISINVVASLIILLSMMGLASLFGINQQSSVISLILYVRCFVMAIFIMGSVRNENDLRIITIYCLVGIAIGALSGLYQYKTGKFSIGTVYDQRAASLRGDPNDTAMILVAGVPLGIYWLGQAKRQVMRLVVAVLLVLILFGVILTFSRGGFVSLCLVMLMYLRRPKLKIVLVGLAVALAIVSLAPRSYWTRMHTLISGHEEHGGSSLHEREMLLRTGLTMFAEHPIFGVGPGNYGLSFGNYYARKNGVQMSQVNLADPVYPAAHNMYLEFFVENGVFAGTLLLAILGWAVRCLFKLDDSAGQESNAIKLGHSTACALGGMLIAGVFLSQGLNSVLWFLVGLGFSAQKMPKQE